MGGQVTISFFFIFYLVSLCLGCIPKISFVACLEVPKKFVWWVGGGGGAWQGSRGDNADFSLMECSFTIRAENPKRNRRPDKPRIIPTISF